eukprot:scaffold284503_cov28-Tisochrysis_lutea.AAC.1
MRRRSRRRSRHCRDVELVRVTGLRILYACPLRAYTVPIVQQAMSWRVVSILIILYSTESVLVLVRCSYESRSCDRAYCARETRTLSQHPSLTAPGRAAVRATSRNPAISPQGSWGRGKGVEVGCRVGSMELPEAHCFATPYSFVCLCAGATISKLIGSRV